MTSCARGVMALEGSVYVCTYHYVSTTYLKCFPNIKLSLPWFPLMKVCLLFHFWLGRCSSIALKIRDIVNEKILESLESNSDENTSGNLFYCEKGSFNLINLLFTGGGVKNNIVDKLIYGLLRIHVHKDSLYYRATSGIYFNKTIKYFLNRLSI